MREMSNHISSERNFISVKMSNLEQQILLQLQCKICFNFMKPPIRLCAKGHSACETCVKKYTTCTICKYPFLTTRNQALEELSFEMDVRCENCDFKCNCAQMTNHQKLCQQKNLIYKCTKEIIQVNYLKKMCSWSGCTEEIFDHFKEFHEKSLYEISLEKENKFQWKLPYQQDQLDINIVHTNDEKFLHFVFYNYMKQKLYFAVINISNSKESFNFEIHVNYDEDKIKYEKKVLNEYKKMNDLMQDKTCTEVSLTNFKHFKYNERVVFWILVVNKDYD